MLIDMRHLAIASPLRCHYAVRLPVFAACQAQPTQRREPLADYLMVSPGSGARFGVLGAMALAIAAE